MLMWVPLHVTAVFFAMIVMPFSRSRSIESMIRSGTDSFARNRPDCHSIASTSVVFPWSTWAMIAMFRMFSRCSIRSIVSRAFAALGALPRDRGGCYALPGEVPGPERRLIRRPMKPTMARQVAFVVMSLVVLFASTADAQAPVWRLMDSGLDGPFNPALDPLAARLPEPSSSIGALNPRVGFGFMDLGVSVAPRRQTATLSQASETTSSLYRLADTTVSTTDVGVDLRLWWPSIAGSDASVLPYVSLGPALGVPVGDDPLATRLNPRSDAGMTLGMHGALGVMWQLAPGASLFGEYRLIQDRGLGTRSGGDVGVDLFYGFSLKF